MESSWLSRALWRRRGAWQWPAFMLFGAGATVTLHELPIAGQGPDWVPAGLLALFFALVAMVVALPFARLVRRRRPDLPLVVAKDRALTGGLVSMLAVLVAAGLIHAPARDAERAAFAAQAEAVERYVARFAPGEFRANVHRASSVRFGDDLFRTCVPGPRPDRAFCLFVDTTESPPGVRLDPNRAPNATYGPPDT